VTHLTFLLIHVEIKNTATAQPSVSENSPNYKYFYMYCYFMPSMRLALLEFRHDVSVKISDWWG